MSGLWSMGYGQVGAGLKRLEKLAGVTVDDWGRMLESDDLARQVGEIFSQSRPSTVETIDPLIRVDRAIRPTYPDWVKQVLHPELELTGPAEFDAAQLGQWLHPDQVNGVTTGDIIWEYLKTRKILDSCLNLRDLEEIQRKGIAFFRKHFQGKVVFGWKSVVLRRFGGLRVPCLVECGGRVVLRWGWLVRDWGSSSPALRFGK